MLKKVDARVDRLVEPRPAEQGGKRNVVSSAVRNTVYTIHQQGKALSNLVSNVAKDARGFGVDTADNVAGVGSRIVDRYSTSRVVNTPSINTIKGSH